MERVKKASKIGVYAVMIFVAVHLIHMIVIGVVNGPEALLHYIENFKIPSGLFLF